MKIEERLNIRKKITEIKDITFEKISSESVGSSYRMFKEYESKLKRILDLCHDIENLTQIDDSLELKNFIQENPVYYDDLYGFLFTSEEKINLSMSLKGGV